MIDIHTHIIPALDDGPPDMAVSVGMGRIAAEEGITTIISTSHNAEGSAVGREEMQRRLDEVRAAWWADGTHIRLELGLEIYLTPTTPAELKGGKLWTLAGSRYVLVELAYQPWPTYAQHTLFELQIAGYVPILAHPERYTTIQANPNVMYALSERGILSQVTAAALLGEHGSEARRTAEVLVAHNMAQFISSDSHGVTVRKRLPRLKGAVEAASRLVGPERAQALVEGNPSAILTNGEIPVGPQRVEPRKWGFGRLFGRD